MDPPPCACTRRSLPYVHHASLSALLCTASRYVFVLLDPIVLPGYRGGSRSSYRASNRTYNFFPSGDQGESPSAPRDRERERGRRCWCLRFCRRVGTLAHTQWGSARTYPLESPSRLAGRKPRPNPRRADTQGGAS